MRPKEKSCRGRKEKAHVVFSLCFLKSDVNVIMYSPQCALVPLTMEQSVNN